MDGKVWRNEIKYVCAEEDLVRIEYSIRNICRLDPHADQNGMYRVRSLYFDDYQNTCFWENENGVAPRKKYRIRIYNENTDQIFMECKHKERDMTRKEDCRITEGECIDLMGGKYWLLADSREPLLKYFSAEMARRLFLPRMIVQYERTAYIYPVGNVRITFDRNIAMSGMTRDFMEQCPAMRPIMPAGFHILEIKYSGILPGFIYSALQVSDLRQTNFSKYYISRRMQCVGWQRTQ